MSVRADTHFAIIPEWVLYADISANAVRLYGVLRRYSNKEGNAHPSRAALAKDIRVSSPRTVDAALSELEEIGAVKTQQRKEGKLNLTSQYTVISAPPSASTRTTPSAADDEGVVQQAAHELRAIEPEIEPFIEFWNLYPKKVEKRAAERAFRSALKRADADVIVAGAERYRDKPGRSPEFTKNPTTWLNGDCWLDESVVASGPRQIAPEPEYHFAEEPVAADLEAFTAAAAAQPWSHRSAQIDFSSALNNAYPPLNGHDSGITTGSLADWNVEYSPERVTAVLGALIRDPPTEPVRNLRELVESLLARPAREGGT